MNVQLQQQAELRRQLADFQQEGNTDAAAATQEKIATLGAEIEATRAKATAMWEAVGGVQAQTATTRIETATLKTQRLGEATQNAGAKSLVTWEEVGNLFANGLSNAFTSFAEAVANGEDAGEAARKAFLKFASDFLLQIGKMIVQRTLLNALGGAKGGGGAGGFLSGLFGSGHTGGIVGSKRVGGGNQSRRVSPAVFAGANYYHSGGFPGLRPNEVPVIAQKNEEILSKSDPRNALNGGGKGAGGGASPVNMKVVNAIDSASVLEAALDSPTGEKVLVNFLRANGSAVKTALNG